jgi:uncharacterized membrane protein
MIYNFGKYYDEFKDTSRAIKIFIYGSTLSIGTSIKYTLL